MKKYIIVGVFAGLFSAVGIAYATTTTFSPTACVNNGWTACMSAFTSDDFRAREMPGGTAGVWRGYQFGGVISAPSIIEVGVEGKQGIGGCQASTSLNFAISVDSGTSYGPEHTVFLPCASDTLTWVNVTNDIASPSLSHAGFRVKARCVTGAECRLDWLPVRVTQ